MKSVVFHRRAVVAPLLSLLLTGVASIPFASCQMKQLTEVKDGATANDSKVLFPSPASCAECHVEIHDEWKRSPHATAFVNEAFRRAADGYKFKECIGCHAPQPWLTSELPQARWSHHELGVVCVSCHLDNGAMVGPKPPTGLVKPHPIAVKPVLFENGAMCGRCHEGTLKQWQASSVVGRQDCSNCHMPEVRRTMTQATGLFSRPIVAMEEPGIEHRHSFDMAAPGTAEKYLELIASVTPDGLEVTLLNKLPHSLPTGDFGVRLVRVMAIATDPVGNTSIAGEWEVSGVAGRSIPSGERRNWHCQLPSDTQQITIEVMRLGREPDDKTLLLRKEVTVQ